MCIIFELQEQEQIEISLCARLAKGISIRQAPTTAADESSLGFVCLENATILALSQA
jgi:hypothetical protein